MDASSIVSEDAPTNTIDQPITWPRHWQGVVTALQRLVTTSSVACDVLGGCHHRCAPLGRRGPGPSLCPCTSLGTVQGDRPRLYWHRSDTRANLGGRQGAAPAATVVERAHDHRARRADKRDCGDGCSGTANSARSSPTGSRRTRRWCGPWWRPRQRSMRRRRGSRCGPVHRRVAIGVCLEITLREDGHAPCQTEPVQ